jgi:hypothetical protein
MDDEKQPDEVDSEEDLDSRELDEEELDEAAGGDPGYTHPDAPNPYIP